MGIVGAAWQELIARNAQRFEEKLGAGVEERLDEAQQSRQLRREGRAAAAGGEIARALDCLQRAIRLAPWVAEGYLELAQLLERMGERGRARRFYALALERDAGLETARERLAMLESEGD
jgi:Flp pilus assembly protein TadD